MNTVSISQLWGRAWNLFKVNWLPLLGIFILSIIVSFIPFIGALIAWVILGPALTQAGFLVARQGQTSFREAFQDFGALLKVWLYGLILAIIPLGLIIAGYSSIIAQAAMSAMNMTEGSLTGPGLILVVAGGSIYLIIAFFCWAGPYAILSGRAGILEAIGQSFSLTKQNLGTVLLALLSAIGLIILGALPCGMGLLVVIPMYYVFLPLLYLELIGESHTPATL